LGVSDIWYLETEKGVTLKCTDTKQIYTGKHKKKVVKHLKTNDTVLVEIDGTLAPDKITLKEKIMPRQIVVQIGLEPGHSFLAGDGKGWMLVSNAKPIEGILT
jgi:hypothetical protein